MEILFCCFVEAAQKYEDYELPLVYLEDFSGITETDWDVDFRTGFI